MPCDMYSGATSGDFALHDTTELKRTCNELTAMLCAMCRMLNESHTLPPEVQVWWEAHRKWDKSQGR